MTREIIIRKYQGEDLSQILPLMAQLGYPAREQELKRRFTHFISHEGYGIALAIKSTQIVGFVAWSKSPLIVSDKTRIHIEGLVTHENYRGLGIGKKLMQYVEEYAQQFSPAIIDLTSGLRRAQDGTHEFYHSLGYRNEGTMAKLYLRKEL